MPTSALISIVEDDAHFRESMRWLLCSLGFRVEVFSSAADLLTSSRLAETACLIADVNMPAMTGIELHKTLIEAGRAIPTILITGAPNDVDRARCKDRGIICYLSKPVDENQLTQCIEAALTVAIRREENL